MNNRCCYSNTFSVENFEEFQKQLSEYFPSVEIIHSLPHTTGISAMVQLGAPDGQWPEEAADISTLAGGLPEFVQDHLSPKAVAVFTEIEIHGPNSASITSYSVNQFGTTVVIDNRRLTDLHELMQSSIAH